MERRMPRDRREGERMDGRRSTRLTAVACLQASAADVPRRFERKIRVGTWYQVS